MAVDKRDRIFPEDALPIVYECRVIDADSGGSYGQPAQPIEAYARILDKGGTGEFIQLDTDIYGTVTIEPMTATRGALLKYTISPLITATSGDYTIYITAVYNDGTVITEDRDFKVLEFT